MRVCLQSAHRTGEDDGTAPPARDDVRHSGFHRLPHAGQVDVDHLVPVEFAGLVQGGIAAVADTGVGHHDVEAAQLLDPAVDGGLDSGGVADVDLGGDDAPVEALHEVGGLGEIVRGWRRGMAVSTPGRMGPAMSIAMMSAPSSASRTAWLRPCPRAAPVTNATLPSTGLPSGPQFCVSHLCTCSALCHRASAHVNGKIRYE